MEGSPLVSGTEQPILPSPLADWRTCRVAGITGDVVSRCPAAVPRLGCFPWRPAEDSGLGHGDALWCPASAYLERVPWPRGYGRASLTGAIAPLTGFSGWARGDLLVIVLLVLGAILLTRLANWVRGRVIAQIDAHAMRADELVRSEAAKHRQVVAQVVTWAVLAVMYLTTAVLVVQRLGVPLAGLVAPAALLSAALGFGLQRFVQDIAAGLFITGERQYGFGNVVPDRGRRHIKARPLAPSKTSPCGSPACGRSAARSSPRPTKEHPPNDDSHQVFSSHHSVPFG